MNSFISQTFFIPSPTITENSLPSQSGRVFIITGGNSGVGYELASILYQNHGTVYIAGRSEARCQAAISTLRVTHSSSNGRLDFLSVDFSDLRTITPAVQKFLAAESRLDFLCNNAGILDPPPGTISPQDHDIQLATNCLGPFLFTKLLTPLLQATASLPSSPPNSVRVSWAGSLGIDLRTPLHGITWDDAKNEPVIDPNPRSMYGASKCGNYFLGAEYARRYGSSGIVSTSFNPGNLRTNLFRDRSWLQNLILPLVSYPSVYGAYTELYTAFATELTATENNGAYVIPWGRVAAPRKDIVAGTKSVEEGGTGLARRFWEWCEKETRAYE